jgi:hypothetical protein
MAGSLDGSSRTPKMGHTITKVGTGKQGTKDAGTDASTYSGSSQKHEQPALASTIGSVQMQTARPALRPQSILQERNAMQEYRGIEEEGLAVLNGRYRWMATAAGTLVPE